MELTDIHISTTIHDLSKVFNVVKTSNKDLFLRAGFTCMGCFSCIERVFGMLVIYLYSVKKNTP